MTHRTVITDVTSVDLSAIKNKVIIVCRSGSGEVEITLEPAKGQDIDVTIDPGEVSGTPAADQGSPQSNLVP